LPIEPQSGESVLILGWHEALRVFAAFDPIRHQHPSASSPSLQIPLSVLAAAATGRVRRHVRGNEEIALAFPPSKLGEYIEYQLYLHDSLEDHDALIDEIVRKSASPEVENAESAIDLAAGRRLRSGQRFRQSVEARQAIERQAMTVARDFLERRGWKVDDVSRSNPYDFRCMRESTTLHVEVKGTTSAGATVLLTPNEVVHARNTTAQVALIVVCGITLSGTSSRPQAKGGSPEVFFPWDIQDDALTPTGYEYRTPRE